MKKHLIPVFLIIASLGFGMNLPLPEQTSNQKKDYTEPGERRHNEWQPPEKIMDAIGLKPGMTIADIGAGGGRFTIWFADRVGPDGKVYANEIKTDLLFYIARRCSQFGFKNVFLRRGTETDPKIPAGTLDIAFMIDVYHHLEEKETFIKNLAPTLKQDGRLVIIENDPDKSGWTSHMTPKNVLIREMDEFGYELVAVDSFLSNDNIYFFRVKIRQKDS